MSRSSHALRWLVLVALLAALAPTAGCGDPEEADYRAPVLADQSWSSFVTVVGDFGPLGGRFEGRFELARFQGYRYPAAAGATLRITLTRRSGPGDPVVVLYGPRASTGIWGRPVALDVGTPGRSAVLDVGPLGEGAWLVLVTTREGDVRGGYLLALTCVSGCEEPPRCPLPPACDGVCYSGFVADADGCVTCECRDECAGADECGLEEECVLGRCEPRCECRAAYEPVCASDGATWPNECEARCRGLDVLASGECAAECPALTCDLECPSGYQRGDDGCERCACLDPCDACARRLVPVCTLNGLTFLNACRARCEGEVVAYAGACRNECAPATDCTLSCPGGYVRDEQGCPLCECLLEPCPVAEAPVCGSDGVTYGSECEADRAGVTALFSGACPPLCRTEADCPEGHACVSGEFGLPACSSDAVDCPAVCVLRPRRCASTTECVPNDVCVTGASIDDPATSGRCVSPCDCHPVYQPVCGVDGHTWQNACRARCAGVAVDSWGPCCDPDVIDGCDLECAGGFARDERGCALCECAEPETCVCAPADNPVCGADGTRYANPCEMRCAGVTAADDPGRCGPGPGGG